MKMSDLYLIASEFEGTSVAALEAMYNSKPIIASNVPGLKDMFKHNVNALLYQVHNPEDLKSKIMNFLDNPEMAKNIGKAARELFDCKYDYSAMIKRYVELIRM